MSFGLKNLPAVYPKVIVAEQDGQVLSDEIYSKKVYKWTTSPQHCTFGLQIRKSILQVDYKSTALYFRVVPARL